MMQLNLFITISCAYIAFEDFGERMESPYRCQNKMEVGWAVCATQHFLSFSFDFSEDASGLLAFSKQTII